MASQRETYVYIAKLAEQAGRYDDMVESMKNIAKLGVELTVEERRLLSVGFTNAVGARRASLRILSSIEEKEEGIEEKEEGRGNEQRIKKYRQMVKDELSSICHDIINVIDAHLIPSSSASDSNVLYYTMKGDYYSYLELNEDALKAYQTASSAAEADLAPTHPTRLGLALNFSVFYYEIMNSPERGYHLAKQAFHEANSVLDTPSEESYKDSTSIMQLLRDNLILWTSDIPEDNLILWTSDIPEDGGMGDDSPTKWSCEVDDLSYERKIEHEENHFREAELKNAEEAAASKARENHRMAQASLDKIKAKEDMQKRRRQKAMYEKVLMDRKMERKPKRGGGRGRGGKR